MEGFQAVGAGITVRTDEKEGLELRITASIRCVVSKAMVTKLVEQADWPTH